MFVAFHFHLNLPRSTDMSIFTATAIIKASTYRPCRKTWFILVIFDHESKRMAQGLTGCNSELVSKNYNYYLTACFAGWRLQCSQKWHFTIEWRQDISHLLFSISDQIRSTLNSKKWHEWCKRVEAIWDITQHFSLCLMNTNIVTYTVSWDPQDRYCNFCYHH